MEYRAFGRTGVRVSPLCLGAMMFGAWGNPDHDESIDVIHAALDAGINFIDTADVYCARRVRGDRRQGDPGPPRRRRARHQGARRRWARTRTWRGNSRRWIIRECEDSLRRLDTDYIDLYQIHRPDPTPTSTRRSARSPTSCTRARCGTSAARRSRPRRSSRRSGWPNAAAASASCASSRRTRSSSAASRPTCCPTCDALRHGRHPVEPARRRLAVGQVAQGRRGPHRATARAGSRCATTCRSRRTSASSTRPTRSATLADEAGISLVHLAVAWVIRNPAVTSAIIGPRTMEQLTTQLGAADVVLDADLLDAHRRDRAAGHELQLGRRRLRAADGRRPVHPPPGLSGARPDSATMGSPGVSLRHRRQ